MPDRAPDFHSKALHSVLFKGRYNWYYCYLKSEKIAHALGIIAEQSTAGDLNNAAEAAAQVPQSIAYLAAGEVTPQAVLADIFGLVSFLRVCATRKRIQNENALVLVGEYEQLVEKIGTGDQHSALFSTGDFILSEMPSLSDVQSPRIPSINSVRQEQHIKDTNKGQMNIKDRWNVKDIKMGHIGQGARTAKILELVKEHKSVSIKDISSIVRGCSEKTIQRELSHLIEQGLVRKIGERRWSTYVLV